MALAMLDIASGRAAAMDFFHQYESEANLLLQRYDKGGWPLTSGAGRLFDAVAALAGIRTHVTFEGQAAVALEAVIDTSESGSYGFEIGFTENMMIFDWRQMINEIVRDVKGGCSSGRISARFHRALIQLLADVATLVKKQYGCNTVVLSGGVFQNAFLLGNGTEKLRERGFTVYSNEKVPVNDGGISFGQAAAAARMITD
jgi:hydrogenase maturation protein HypF